MDSSRDPKPQSMFAYCASARGAWRGAERCRGAYARAASAYDEGAQRKRQRVRAGGKEARVCAGKRVKSAQKDARVRAAARRGGSAQWQKRHRGKRKDGACAVKEVRREEQCKSEI